jgi:serine/threonine-protein kinase
MAALVDGRYELIDVIGSGGMATVWRARDVKLERQVALKRPHPMPAGDPRLDRLSREARLAASISHPHLVSVHDAGSDADGLYLVMELVEAPSLAQVGAGLTPHRVIETGAQVSRALAAVHRAGVVHRDVKPGNILMAEGGAKLTDFGIATADTPLAGNQPTAPGTLLATANYAAPEVLAGHPASDRSDVFALGVVLYELLAGRPPFSGVDRTQRPAPLSGPVGPVLDRCLSPYPGDRPSASDLAAELNGVLAEFGAAGFSSAAIVTRGAPAANGAPVAYPPTSTALPPVAVTPPATGSGVSGSDSYWPPAGPPIGPPTGGHDPSSTEVMGARPPMVFGEPPRSTAGPGIVEPARRPPSTAWIGPAVFGVIALAAVVTVLALLSGVLSGSDSGEQASSGGEEPQTSVTVPSVEDDQTNATEAAGDQDDSGSADDTGGDQEGESEPSDQSDGSGESDGGDGDGDSGFGFGGLFDSLGEVDDFVDSVTERAEELDATARDVRDVMKKVEEATKKARDGKPEEAAEKLEEAAEKVSERLDGRTRDDLLNLLDDVAEQLDLADLNLAERYGEGGEEG